MIKIKDIIGLPTLEWHLLHKRTLSENVYRYSSESFIQLFAEARQAWRDGKIQLNEFDEQLLRETDIGEYGIYEGEKVPLDLPMIDEANSNQWEKIGAKKLAQEFAKDQPDRSIGGLEFWIEKYSVDNNITDPMPKDFYNYELYPEIISLGYENPERNLNEAEYQGREVPLNKPKRGGPKKFYVYVKNPKTGKVKKVNFGDSGNLSVKIKEPGARASFAARHNCDKKKDKTKPGYWSCNIGRYWKSLGGSRNFSGYW